MDKRQIFIFFVIASIFFSFIPEANADAINPDSVNWLDTDISDWDKTSDLSVGISGNRIKLNYDGADEWESVEGAVGNAWFIAQINGRWYGATWDWMRPGQNSKSTVNLISYPTAMKGVLKNFCIKQGETYGFMTSTWARSSPGKNGEERSEIVLERWTGNVNPNCGGTTTTKYSCNQNNQCVSDPNGIYSDSSCNNACEPGPGPGPQVKIPQLLGINPTSPLPGDNIEIIGVNLTNEIVLTNLSTNATYEIDASLNSNAPATATLDEEISPGNYRMIVLEQSGLQSNGLLITIQPLTVPVSPPIQEIKDFGDLIENIFTWALWLVGAAVFVNFLWAGFLWFASRGNAGMIGSAKEKMFNALIGAIILLASYIILNTINPDLVKQVFTLPGL